MVAVVVLMLVLLALTVWVPTVEGMGASLQVVVVVVVPPALMMLVAWGVQAAVEAGQPSTAQPPRPPPVISLQPGSVRLALLATMATTAMMMTGSMMRCLHS